jgi:hypothetical protein
VKLIRTAFIALAMLAVAGPAAATHFETVTANADCDGWSVDASLIFGSLTVSADVDWQIDLVEGAVVVTSATGSGVISRESPTLHAEGVWGMELCGTYEVQGMLHLATVYNEDTATFTLPLVCDCGDDACHFTPGYWKNHPEAWPLTTLTLGGETYDQAELLEILDHPVHGDASVILAHHLIAALLNVAAGADDGIQPEIDEANDLLADSPLYSRPCCEPRRQILAVKDELCAYNEMGCPDDLFGKAMSLESKEELLLEDVEASSWGAVKGLYR